MAITLDGTTGTTTPNVVLPGSASGTITLAAPSAAGTQSYTLPSAVPAVSGYALTATTAGVMSWAAATTAPGGSNTQVQFNNSSAFGGSANFVWDGTYVGVGTSSPSTYSDLAIGITTYQSSAGGRSGIIMGSNATATDDPLGFVNFFSPNTTNTSYRMGGMRMDRGTDANSAYLRWHTANSGNPVERMRLTQQGYLLIGYTTSNGSYNLQVNSQIFATSATIATSDGRYKKDVTPITGGLDLVNKLNPVSFNWNPHPVHNFDTDNVDIGFIAQEVQSALADSPYLSNIVKSNQTELPDGTKEDFLGIADGKLIPILVKAIQELTARLAALEAK